MYISVLPTFRFTPFAPREAEQKYPMDHILFRYGRDALWAALEYLQIGPEHEVLLPASLCDVVLVPFIKRNIAIQYYDLNHYLEPDTNEIEARITNKTHAIYVNHYLGRPTNLVEIRKICDRHQLSLIEDCAHALGGSDSTGPLGSTGDVAIFSYRKSLLIPDGGGLKINATNQPFLEIITEKPSFLFALKSMVRMLVLGLASHGFLPLASWKRRTSNLDRYLTVEDTLSASDWSAPIEISNFSRKHINKMDVESMGKTRRDNYQFWQKNIPLISGCRALFPPLQEGHVPYSFPLLTQRRDELIRHLYTKGIYLEPTIGPVYRNIDRLTNPDENFAHIETIAEEMISLPVHQALNPLQRDHILRVIQQMYGS